MNWRSTTVSLETYPLYSLIFSLDIFFAVPGRAKVSEKCIHLIRWFNMYYKRIFCKLCSIFCLGFRMRRMRACAGKRTIKTSLISTRITYHQLSSSYQGWNFLQPKVKFTLGIEFGFYKCRYALEFLFALITKCSVNIKFKHFLKANPCGFLGVLYRKLVLTVNRRTK